VWGSTAWRRRPTPSCASVTFSRSEASACREPVSAAQQQRSRCVPSTGSLRPKFRYRYPIYIVPLDTKFLKDRFGMYRWRLVEARRRGWFSDAAGTGEDCTEIGIKTCSAGSEYLWVPPASCSFRTYLQVQPWTKLVHVRSRYNVLIVPRLSLVLNLVPVYVPVQINYYRLAGEGSILDLGENFGHVGSILAERGCSFGSYEFVI